MASPPDPSFHTTSPPPPKKPPNRTPPATATTAHHRTETPPIPSFHQYSTLTASLPPLPTAGQVGAPDGEIVRRNPPAGSLEADEESSAAAPSAASSSSSSKKKSKGGKKKRFVQRLFDKVWHQTLRKLKRQNKHQPTESELLEKLHLRTAGSTRVNLVDEEDAPVEQEVEPSEQVTSTGTLKREEAEPLAARGRSVSLQDERRSRGPSMRLAMAPPPPDVVLDAYAGRGRHRSSTDVSDQRSPALPPKPRRLPGKPGSSPGNRVSDLTSSQAAAKTLTHERATSFLDHRAAMSQQARSALQSSASSAAPKTPPPTSPKASPPASPEPEAYTKPHKRPPVDQWTLTKPIELPGHHTFDPKAQPPLGGDGGTLRGPIAPVPSVEPAEASPEPASPPAPEPEQHTFDPKAQPSLGGDGGTLRGPIEPVPSAVVSTPSKPQRPNVLEMGGEWATLEGLIERITRADSENVEIRNAFLLTMHYVTTPPEVLSLIIDNLKKPPPELEEEADEQRHKERAKLWNAGKIRLFSVLKHWVKTYPSDFNHPSMSGRLREILSKFPPLSWKWEHRAFRTENLRIIARAILDNLERAMLRLHAALEDPNMSYRQRRGSGRYGSDVETPSSSIGYSPPLSESTPSWMQESSASSILASVNNGNAGGDVSGRDSVGQSSNAPPHRASDPPMREYSYSNASESGAPAIGSSRDHWIPDDKAKECMVCFRAFTLTNRRHHCRNCGIVVCGRCSGKRAAVPSVDKRRKVRVCDRCFEVLEAAKASANLPPNATLVSTPPLDARHGRGLSELQVSEVSEGSSSVQDGSVLSTSPPTGQRRKHSSGRQASVDFASAAAGSVSDVPNRSPGEHLAMSLALNFTGGSVDGLLNAEASAIAAQLTIFAKRRMLDLNSPREFIKDTQKWLKKLRRKERKAAKEKVMALRGKSVASEDDEPESGDEEEDEETRQMRLQESLIAAIRRTIESMMSAADSEFGNSSSAQDASEAVVDLFAKFCASSNQRQGQMRMSNQMSLWVSSEILKGRTTSERQRMLYHWIEVAHHCYELRNYNSVFEIMTGLSHSSIYRLRYELPRSLESTYERLCDVVHYDKNYHAYRAELAKLSGRGTPLIPYLGVMLRDLVSLEESGHFKHEQDDKTYVQVTKLRRVARLVIDTLNFRHGNFDFVYERANTPLQLRLVGGIMQTLDDDELMRLSYEIKPRPQRRQLSMVSVSATPAERKAQLEREKAERKKKMEQATLVEEGTEDT